MMKYLLEKEFKQIIRNPFLPKMILIFPCMVLLILPLAANYEIKNINLSIVDNDHSSYSQRLVNKVTSSGYFNLTDVSDSYTKALKSVEADNSDMILEIPENFERNIIRESNAKVMISANAVNGTKGGLGSSYLSGIAGNFASEVRSELIQSSGLSAMPSIDVVPVNRFNPHMSYKVFMVPALMVMLLTILCGFLPALNIVGEKEAGTIEQINVTPVKKFSFILAKLIPYWIIGYIVLTIGFGIAYAVYGLIPAGHLSTIYMFATVYILAVSGMGLVISNYSETMQQAMFVIFFFMMVFILISGLYTPINSMPQWAKYLTYFNPLKYFIEIMRLVYLKGSGFESLYVQFFSLCAFAATFNIWAVLSYKKSS